MMNSASPGDSLGDYKAMASGVQGDTRYEWLEFGEAHDGVWTLNALAIGITAPQATEYASRVATSRTKYDAMIAAREAAKAATEAWYNASFAMKDYGASLISLIRGKAENTGDANVYVLAQIPAPATPQPAGPPTDATAMTAELTNLGNVQLKWNGTLFARQFFSVWRKLNGETDWTQIGVIAAKAFLDENVPLGTQWASYLVRAHRGTQVSQGSEPVTILLYSQQQAA